MKVKVEDVKKLMSDFLSKKGYNPEDTSFIINMFLGGELRGHTSHGLASFSSFAEKDYSNLPKPEVIKETNAVYVLNAKSNSGNIIGRQAANEAIKRAKKEIVGTAIIKNMESWLRPGAIAEYIANQGFVAIVTNDGGGTSIAPPGGYDPTLGTNPIAYGIPTSEAPLVVDLALAKKAWGNVRLANKYGTDLPADSFYNDKGEITLDPKDAHSVKAAGDYKGYALALLIEVLCGSLLGMEMMIDSTAGATFAGKLPDRGGLILVLDPSQTADPVKFKQENTKLLQRISATHELDGQKIRIPGYESAHKQKVSLESDSIELPDELWQELQSLHT